MARSNDTIDDFMDTMLRETEGPPRRRRNKKPESKVQKAIAAYLRSLGAVVAITDAGILNKMGLGMSCGIPTGWPDITACMPGGRFLGVECKAPKGRQSVEQKNMQTQIELSCGLYILARSLDELKAELHKENVLLESSD